ncbi:MAG: hypothetical protein AABX01_07840 [Candidatus Micrarchaeota archaeon]
MGVLESLKRLEEVKIHTGARTTLGKVRDDVLAGNLFKLGPKEIVALAVLGELSAGGSQPNLIQESDNWQISRGWELAKHAAKLHPRDLTPYMQPQFLEALNQATEHPKFNIAMHAQDFAQFLRITKTETSPKEPVARDFPREAVLAYLALRKAHLDVSLPHGERRYTNGIRAIWSAKHTNLWNLFRDHSEFFGRIAAFADLVPTLDLRRLLDHMPRIKVIPKEQTELFKKWEAWASVVYHPELAKYLEIYKHTPGHNFIIRNAPAILKKLNGNEDLLIDEKRALYAWVMKAYEGGEGREKVRERYLLENFDQGKLDIEQLNAIRVRLDQRANA